MKFWSPKHLPGMSCDAVTLGLLQHRAESKITKVTMEIVFA